MPSGNILGKLVNFIQDQKQKWPLFYFEDTPPEGNFITK